MFRTLQSPAYQEPARLLKAYIKYMFRLGGQVRRAKITSISKNKDGIAVSSTSGETETFDNVIVAAGA